MRTKKLEQLWEDITGQAVWICKNKNGLQQTYGEKILKSHYIIQKISNGEVINYFLTLKQVEEHLNMIKENKNYFM